MEVSVVRVSRSRERMDKCVLIWGQHLHVWQWLAEPACLTVGRFTACWMDIGSVWSIKHQSDICLAFFSISGALHLSCMPGKLKWEHIRIRRQNIFCSSGTDGVYLLKSDQRGVSFSLPNISAEDGNGIKHIPLQFRVLLHLQIIVTITPTLSNWNARPFQTGNQQSATVGSASH